MAINQIIIMGRLAGAPTTRYIQGSNASVTRFTLAVERDYKAQGEESPKADFINCVAWNKTGEFIDKYFSKGSMIAVTGSLETGSYTDRETGKTVYTTDVRVNKVSFTGERRNETPAASSGDGFMNVPDGIDEDLPFN